MYEKNGIVYSGEQRPALKISGVRAMDDYSLWIRFTNGEARTFRFGELLETPAFSPLKDKELFNSVYIDYGVPVWDNGNIDIAPEYLYEHGICCDL